MNKDLLEVRIYGDPVLRQKAAQIEQITPAIRALAERMTVTMYEHETRGIGLAAPQVGVSLRLVTLATVDDPAILPPNPSPGECLLCPRMPLALINPEILWRSAAADSCSEGCLSVPDIYADVVRPTTVLLQTELMDGQKISVECGGLLARCLQHEIDHLNGTFFVDRVDAETAGTIAPQLQKLEKIALKRLKKRQKQC